MVLNFLYNLIIRPLEFVVELIFSYFYDVFAETRVPNALIAITAVSLLINLLVLPLYKRSDAMQEEEREKQKQMKPWLDHIKKTFKGDERFMMTQAYYREQNYKPIYVLKSSISLLLQVPFFMAAYNYLSNLSLLEGAYFWILEDLGKPDELIHIGSVTINLLPILMTAVNILSGMIYTKGFSFKEKLQLYGMALIFLVLLYDSPSGLVYYWLLNNVFSLVKNIIMKKAKNPRLVTAIMGAFLGVFVNFICYERCIMTPERGLIFAIFLIVFCLPLAKYIIDRKLNWKRTFEKCGALFPDLKTSTYVVTIFLMILLFGAVIPLSVISSSAVEFATTNYTPYHFITYPLIFYTGLFGLWFSVFFALGTQKFRKGFIYALFGLTVAGLVNFFIFSQDNGTITTALIFDSIETISYEMSDIVLNWVVGIVALVIAIILLAWKEDKVRLFGVVLIVGLLAVSGSGLVSVNKNLKENRYEGVSDKKEESDTKEAKALDKKIHLSTDGKNVVVFMLDRAIGEYIPRIMEENETVRKAFEGFVYYSNTMSFATHTNMAAPALFGGYEYTPDQMNLRTDEKLSKKHDEAMKVLPTIFLESEDNYSVEAYDLPFLGYSWTSNPAVLNNLGRKYQNRVTADNLEGEYANHYLGSLFMLESEDSMEWNFLMYSIFRTSPLGMQPYIYHDGVYFSTKYSRFTDSDFLESYSTLLALNDITEITEDDENHFLEFQNATTHNVVLLDSKTYEPSLNTVPQRGSNWLAEAHYSSNMAALIKVANWINYLKDNGAWDNTKMILVSDHGYNTHEFDELELKDDESVESYSPVLMVKDFGATGEMVTDETFMTNADMPTLLLEGLFENPVNPYTGNPITSDAKTERDMIVTTSHDYSLTGNNGYQFNSANTYIVKDDVHDVNNWTFVKKQ